MAIVKMSSFSLLAFDSERDKLLGRLQNFGYVHFNNPDESLLEEGLEPVSIPESIGEVDEEISKVKYAIEVLSKYYEKETGIKAMIKGLDTLEFEELEEKAKNIDYIPTYERLRELTLGLDDVNSKSKSLEENRDELLLWKRLRYPIEELDNFKQLEVFMGTIPKKMKASFDDALLSLSLTYVEEISDDKDSSYIYGVTWKEEVDTFNEILRNNGFSRIKLSGTKTPEEEIKLIDDSLDKLKLKGEDILESIKGLSGNLPEFEIVYEYLMNKKLKLMTSENFVTTEKVNLIRGYIPTDKKDAFKSLIDETLEDAYYVNIEDAELDDPNVPVLLENSKFNQNFESLTEMYSLPKYNEIDPTPFLTPFYLIFFGMMGADFGYGLIMLIGTFIALKMFNLNDGSRKFLKFFHYLSYSVMAWGLVYGSIFGGIVPSPIKALINPAEEYNSLLVLSIIFGIFHIFYGLAINAYMSIRDGRPLDALYDVGFWFLALLGSIGFLLAMVIDIPLVIKNISLLMMIIGMAGIVLFGARDAKNIGGRLAGGVYELYGISGYIGDFVSYSRLMALGLSGGFIASSINLMAGMAAESGPIGIFFGAIIFIIGQAFNFGLSILSAYVHTIRLTFVEFFGKFYEGGGVRFKQFRSNTKYINLK